jgi:pimeloyl-ACP methyl ester carboxylesterase
MPLVYAGPARVEEPRDEAHERARKIRPEYTRGELVRVAGGRNQAEAELIQGLLLEEGVPSMLRRTAGFDVPDFLAAGPRDVMVPESGAERARETLNDAQMGAVEGEPQPFGSRALRLFAGVLVVGFFGLLVAWLLFQTGT